MTAWRWTWAGDLLGRVGIVGYFTFAAVQSLTKLYTGFANWQSLAVDNKVLWVLSQFSVLIFLGLVITTTIFRLKSLRSADGLEPRLSALAGTFLLGVLAVLPAADYVPPALRMLGLLLILTGFAVSAYVLSWLGRSFSIMAEARALVAAGPYAQVRHPLYVAEEIAILGILLLHFSPAAAALGVLHWLLQLSRMHNEEQVLSAAFPEYGAYAAQTPRVIPKFLIPAKHGPG